jgi:hypothetical protein
MTTATLLAATLLALVHLFTPALRFLGGTPRSVWLSVAGGVSVAYVFVHLLPELAEGQLHVSRAVDAAAERPAVPEGVPMALGFAERHVYVIALAGLAVFYGLDKLAKRSRGQRPEGTSPGDDDRPHRHESDVDPETATSAGVFWIHMGSFGLYNVLIGYLLLHRETAETADLAFFAVAMALHFLVTDFGLNEDHRHRYRGVGRWLLVLALAAGVALGAGTALPRATVAVLIAFLAGGVILNVLKEEVPDERQSRFWAFTGGMAAYAALLLAL